MKSRWAIVAVSTLALVVSNGLAIGGMPVFSKPIRDEFVAVGAVDGARAESFIAVAANITFLMSGVFSLLGGWLLTLVRIRTVMLIGCLLLGGGLLLHAFAETTRTVYTARFVMGASLGFVGVAPNVVLISRWFRERRGTALGIVLTGTSIGGVLLPLISAPVIEACGWRTTLSILSLIVWLILIPAVVLLVREPERAPDLEIDLEHALSFRAAVGSPLFWAFGLCAALVFYPIFVTSQQFILYLQSPKIAVSATTAAFAQSALFAVSVGGKFLAGYVSDRLRTAGVMAACAGLMFASTLVLFALTANTALFFLLPFALGYGGTFVLLQRLAADLFGRRDLGKILGLVTLIEVTGAAVGGRVTGYLADRAGGDYTHAFYGVTVAAALAFLASLAIIGLANKRSLPAV